MSYLVDRDQMTDREKELADYWLEKGREHATPSKLTQKFMGEINTHLQYIREKLDNNTKEHDDLKDTIKNLTCETEKKFASKWVERVLTLILTVFGIGVLGVMGNIFLDALSKE